MLESTNNRCLYLWLGIERFLHVSVYQFREVLDTLGLYIWSGSLMKSLNKCL